MGSRRSWAARQIERGRFLGSGSYGLIQTIAAAPERAGLVRDVEDRDGDGARAGAPGGVPPLGRRVTRREYLAALEAARKEGLWRFHVEE